MARKKKDYETIPKSRQFWGVKNQINSKLENPFLEKGIKDGNEGI
jgi:hypothetical protein